MARTNALIGANGAGKSNLLSVLRMVLLMRTQSLRRFVGEQGGASALLHYGPSTTRELSLRLEFTNGARRNAYSARLGYAAGDSCVFLDETAESRASPDADPKIVSLGAGHTESRLSELGLHPSVITLLVSLVRSVSSRCQVLLATQSPALLDEFEADEVIVVDRNLGQTYFKQLDSNELARHRGRRPCESPRSMPTFQ